jgi:hypothetical protein
LASTTVEVGGITKIDEDMIQNDKISGITRALSVFIGILLMKIKT